MTRVIPGEHSGTRDPANTSLVIEAWPRHRRLLGPGSRRFAALGRDDGLHYPFHPFANVSISAGSNLLMSSIRSLVMRSVVAVFSFSRPFFTRKST